MLAMDVANEVITKLSTNQNDKLMRRCLRSSSLLALSNIQTGLIAHPFFRSKVVLMCSLNLHIKQNSLPGVPGTNESNACTVSSH